MKTSVECNAGGHASCPHSFTQCSCECHPTITVSSEEQSTEHTDESGNVFVTNYYGDAVPQMLDAPSRAYTDAHWAIEKAIEIDNDVRMIIPNAEAILAFLEEHAYAHAGEDAETEVLFNMNASPVAASPQRGSWR